MDGVGYEERFASDHSMGGCGISLNLYAIIRSAPKALSLYESTIISQCFGKEIAILLIQISVFVKNS